MSNEGDNMFLVFPFVVDQDKRPCICIAGIYLQIALKTYYAFKGENVIPFITAQSSHYVAFCGN